MFSNPRQHARAYFFPFMKSKSKIRPAVFCKDAVRAFLPFNVPADIDKCFQYACCLNGSPFHN